MRIRTIEIKPVINGYIVQVGCQPVVFDSKEKLLTELKRYLDNPATVEKEYFEKALNPVSIPTEAGANQVVPCAYPPTTQAMQDVLPSPATRR